MLRRVGVLLVTAAWLHAPCGTPARAANPALVRVEAHRVSMACVYSIVAYGPQPDAVAATLDDALDEVDRIDRLMSHYRPDSALSELNRDAARGPVIADPELFDLLASSLHYSIASGGAFDITVGPLMKVWGFFHGDGRLPDDREIALVRQRIGYRHVRLDPARGTVAFDRPGVELDLGGIAKGYAVDRVVALLARRGIRTALVSAGGSTQYGVGAPPGRPGWQVDVQDPIDAGKVAFTTTLKDRALSVAGRSEKFFEANGVRYSHIMDPRTGRPVQGMLSVAVLSDTGTSGDALDDALFVLGVERSRAILRYCPRTEATFLLPDTRRPWRMVRAPPDELARP